MSDHTRTLFSSPDDILCALCAAQMHYVPRTTSLMRFQRRGRRPTSGPFGPGFLATIDTRRELARLLDGLDARSRILLVLWCVEDQPVGAVAARLGVSRVHCYRLREKALRAMLAAHRERTENLEVPVVAT